MRKTITITLAVLISFMVLESAQASPEHWTEVTRFTGSTDQNTIYFTCSHNEWRLNWTYTPNAQYPTLAGFACTIKDNESLTIDSIYQTGNETTSGLTYMHNKPGTFYLTIGVANLVDYTIIIEQDLDSIPEYPVGLLFAMLTIAIGIATATRHRARPRAP